jgi:hypothetical protein
MKCADCEYWTPLLQGLCSQSKLTDDGKFVKLQTAGTYGCTTFSKKKNKGVTVKRLSSPNGEITEAFNGLNRNTTYVITIEEL